MRLSELMRLLTDAGKELGDFQIPPSLAEMIEDAIEEERQLQEDTDPGRHL